MTGARSWRRSSLIGAVAAVVTFLVIAPPSSAGHLAEAASGACPNTTTINQGGSTSSSSSTTTIGGDTASTTIATTAGGGLGGTAGTDIALPNTSSCQAVTLSGGAFSGLQVTLDQTQDLTNQAISVSWTGATPSTVTDGFDIDDNYLQLMQCWGDDTTTGPPPEQCEFGTEAASYVAEPPQVVPNVGAYPSSSFTKAVTRVLSIFGSTCGSTAPAGCMSYDQFVQLASSSNQEQAYVDQAQESEVLDPFQPIGQASVPVTTDEVCCDTPPPWTQQWDQNPWFNHTTTNEVDFARTYADGTGQTLFQMQTEEEAPGLGCGQAQTNADGSPASPPDCWLVIVPRGSAASENLPGDDNGYVDTSPLNPIAWQHRIAIPLGFQPVGTACTQSSTTDRLLGGEMAAAAVASWQPILCGQSGAPSYLYTDVGDDLARTDLPGGGPGVIGGVVTLPLDPSTVDPDDPLVYAPLTLSGAVIAFNIERQPQIPTPTDEDNLITVPVTQLNLTPRLVAKLLTESYVGGFGPFGPPASDLSCPSTSPPPGCGWMAKNPYNLISDPDFLQYNPEFAELTAGDYKVNSAQLVLEQPSSDAAATLWQWILGDPAAAAWLGGQPDPWGMQVNPYYLTDAPTNPSGVAFANPAPDNFPQNDPYCFTPTGAAYQLATVPIQEARALCFLDWDPYTNKMATVAQDLLAANSGAKTTFNPGAQGSDSAWAADGPQTSGEDIMYGVTTTDQAAQYGLKVASLSQDGDDGPSPTFIAPDTAGLTAGAAAMQPSHVSGVLDPNPSTNAAGAYPLSLLTYAAVAPVGLSASEQAAAAALLTYAAGPGQTPGVAPGSLPLGYVPLPSSLVAETTQAAATVLDPSSLVSTTTTAAPTTTEASATTEAPATTAAPSTTAAAGTVSPTTGAPSTGTPATTASAPGAPTVAAPYPAVGAVSPIESPSPPSALGGAQTSVSPQPRQEPVVSGALNAALPASTSSARTPGTHPGFSRFALLVALLVGVVSLVSSQALLLRR